MKNTPKLSYYKRRKQKKAEMKRAGYAAATFYLVIASIGWLALTAPQSVDTVVEAITPVAQASGPTDPCGLDVVICEGEEMPELVPAHETVEDMIVRLADEYGVDPDRSLALAFCESRYQVDAVNWEGSTATGVFQWTKPTWEHIGSPGDRLNAEDNIRAFMEWYPKYPGWWECDKLVD